MNNHLDKQTAASLYSVETMTARSRRLTWHGLTIELAELLARKLSVAAIDDETYPHPFEVVDSGGQVRCRYQRGTRYAEALAA
jgi:hypothetical protein